MTTEVEIRQPDSVLTLTEGQTWWTERQRAALQQIGIDNAPNGDLLVFLHHCQRTGLDPFAKQIYMIARQGKWTIQTGIDGYRVIGDRVAERRGDEIEHEEALWSDGNGIWRDVWLTDEPPAAAKYTIVRNGKRNIATVHYREYVQTTRDGSPNSMWKRMPCNQLAKCAEAAAWRKVYPNDFAGILLEGAALPSEQRTASAPTAPAYVPVARATEVPAQPVEAEAEQETVIDRSDELVELFATEADSEA